MEAEADGTLPATLTTGQVWMRSDGGVQLLDVAVSAEPAASPSDGLALLAANGRPRAWKVSTGRRTHVRPAYALPYRATLPKWLGAFSPSVPLTGMLKSSVRLLPRRPRSPWRRRGGGVWPIWPS